MKCQIGEIFSHYALARKNAVANSEPQTGRQGGDRLMTHKGKGLMNKKTNASDMLDKLGTISDCQRAVYNLMDPSAELQHDQRADVAMLLEFLATEQANAQTELETSLRGA